MVNARAERDNSITLSYATIWQLRDTTVETKLCKGGESELYISSIKSLDGISEVVKEFGKEPDKIRLLLTHRTEVVQVYGYAPKIIAVAVFQRYGSC
ncbi:MAG TPA: hypothetical protein VE439_03565 [Anaerolineae bacterium]|jgi:hypothetical protein|nr:hypothetical protein [Anaerolineae bacterium]